jgi:hypothetical protein
MVAPSWFSAQNILNYPLGYICCGMNFIEDWVSPRGGTNAKEKKTISSRARNRNRVMKNSVEISATLQILFNKTERNHDDSEAGIM